MSPRVTRPRSSSADNATTSVFTERLRVEVLVASEHAQAVLDAINEYSGGRRSGFVQQAAEPLTEATEQGS